MTRHSVKYIFVMLGVLVAGQVLAQDLIPPPADPDHYFAGHMADNEFIVDQTSSPENTFDPTTKTGHMINVNRNNPYKIFWIHLILNRQNSSFNPEDMTNPWVTADAGPNYTTEDGERAFQSSGSSQQFLELWKIIIIRPNPSWEDWSCAPIFAGSTAPPSLMALEIKTKCVPEPASLLALGLGAAGVFARRRKTRA
ncbi:MAG: hypothetical protein BGO01_15260 [Armatimonadetes bacterium 55-13]|nr:PEP-CTERM sorting domain-containing protein [Armatimonadota bacterium]OJU65225.1 MAG: hypothetical protein BGO01_15260 [Armatimonadetes bacterium 55-13]